MLDYAAVASYSAALIALAAGVWLSPGIAAGWVSVVSAVAAAGLLGAGIANMAEDWFGIRVVGVVYVAAILVGTFALLPLGVLLGRDARTRWIALLPLLTVAGLVSISQWYGAAILAVTWVVAGALHTVGRLPLSSDRR